MDKIRTMCSYCGKWFEKVDTETLPFDDQPHLERRYCQRCYPEVRQAHLSLPWIKNKTTH